MKENFHIGTCARVSRLFLLYFTEETEPHSRVFLKNSHVITEMAKVSSDKKGASLSPVNTRETVRTSVICAGLIRENAIGPYS